VKLRSHLVAAWLAVAISLLAGPGWADPLAFTAGGLRLRTPVKSMVEIRNEGIVRQRWDYSCGSAALSTVLTHHLGDPTDESAVVVSILRRADPLRVRSRGGFSLLDLKHYLGRRGYQATGYADLSLADLEEFAVPPIVPVHLKGYDHFVVFRGRHGDRVVLADPAFGNLTMSTGRFEELWKDGVGFVVSGADRHDPDGASPNEASLPFANLRSVQRFVSGGTFARPGFNP
jgi:hypothetical protein